MHWKVLHDSHPELRFPELEDPQLLKGPATYPFHFSRPPLYTNPLPPDVATVPGFHPPTVASRLIERYPPTSGRAGGKVNLDLRQVVFSGALSARGRRLAVALANTPPSCIHASWESVAIIALLLCDQFSDASWMYSDFFHGNYRIMMEKGLAYAAKVNKELHSGARMVHSFPGMASAGPPGFSRSLYGLDTLVGRSEFLPLDVPAEMRMRMSDPTIRRLPAIGPGGSTTWGPQSQYDRALNAAIQEAVDSANTGIIEPLPFKEWYETRMFWAAAGGAPGAAVRWDTDTPLQRLNKRGALLLLPASHYQPILRNALGAVLWSKCAPKYENGKMRAIWNTSVEHYVIQAYLVDMLERNQDQSGWNASAHHLRHKVNNDLARLGAVERGVGTMWDYSDFNINHTIPAQVGLYRAIDHNLQARLPTGAADPTQAARRRATRHDLTSCLQYLVKAKETIILEDPETGTVATVVRSMQSGERITSVCNTYLNRAYTILVRRWIHHNLGYDPLPSLAYHQGDDAYEISPNILYSCVLCTVYNLLGFAGQAFKITADYGGSAEFLRLSHNAKTGELAGYPVRSAMGLIAGEFFREFVGDPATRVGAYVDQFAKVMRRGAHLHPALLTALLQTRASVSYTDETGIKHHITPDPIRVMTPRFAGGYGVSATDPALSGASSIIAYAHDAFAPPPPVHGGGINAGVPVPRYSAVAMIRVAIGVPSGEGKSVLARTHPTIFVDHDSFMSPADYAEHSNLVRVARESGDWSAVNAKVRALVPQSGTGGRVLLTWGPQTTPEGFQYLGAAILPSPSNIRANTDNRSALAHGDQPTLTTRPHPVLGDFFARNRRIMALVGPTVRSQLVAHVARTSRSPSLLNPLIVPAYSGPSPPPYTAPRVNTTLFFGRAALRRFGGAPSLPDFRRTAALNATPAIPRQQALILASALGGAYAPEALSANVADYARLLHCALQKGARIPQGLVITMPIPDRLPHFFAQWDSYVSQELARSYLDPAYAYHIPGQASPFSEHLSHKYGYFSSLTRDAGFSSDAAVAACVAELQPTTYPGKAGRWFTFVLAMPPLRRARPLRDLSSVFSQLQLPAHFDFATDYLAGHLDLVPPLPTGYRSSTVASLIRAFVLSYIERTLPFVDLDRTTYPGAVCHLETLATETLPLLLSSAVGAPLTLSE